MKKRINILVVAIIGNMLSASTLLQTPPPPPLEPNLAPGGGDADVSIDFINIGLIGIAVFFILYIAYTTMYKTSKKV